MYEAFTAAGLSYKYSLLLSRTLSFFHIYSIIFPSNPRSSINMRVSRANVDLPVPDINAEPALEEEVREDRPLDGLLPDHVGTVQQPVDPPIKRLSLVFKLERPAQEMPAQRLPLQAENQARTSRTSRTGRVIKPPTAFVPASVATTGKRSRGARKKDANVVCTRCGRGHSPSTNMIVFCDGCNSTWHQKCHDPPITDEVVNVKEMEWLCHNCKPVPAIAKKVSKTQKSARVKTEKSTEEVHSKPQEAFRLEVGGDQFTADERRAYLSCQSHATLVELLVKISTENPSVPMFPANMRNLPASQFPARPTPQANAADKNASKAEAASANTSKKRAHAGSTAVKDSPELDNTDSRKRARTASAPAEPAVAQTSTQAQKESRSRTKSAPSVRQASITQSTSNAPTNEAEADSPSTTRSRKLSATPALTRNSRQPSPADSHSTGRDIPFMDPDDHRLYPRAGNGFSPSANPDDLNILKEDPESSTFSHSLHGPARDAVAAKQPVPRWEFRKRK